MLKILKTIKLMLKTKINNTCGFDNDKNLYINGKKYEGKKVKNHGFKAEDGWQHVMTKPDGVKFYIKKRGN